MMYKYKCENKYHEIEAKVKKMQLIERIHLKVAYGPSATVMAILAMLDFYFGSFANVIVQWYGGGRKRENLKGRRPRW